MNPLRLVDIKIEVRSTNESYPGIYRLYVDSDLITERSWTFETDYAINENLLVTLPLGRHRFRLIPVNCNPTNFSLHNFHINHKLIHPVCKSLEFDFAVDASIPAVV